MEDASWWIWEPCPTEHKSQNSGRPLVGKQGRGAGWRKDISFLTSQHSQGWGGLKVRLGRKGGQLSKSVTQQPSLSLDRGGHRWGRGKVKKEPALIINS